MRRTVLVSSIAAATLLSGAALPMVAQAAGQQLRIIEWVNPPAVNATKAIDKTFTKATHIKVQLETANGRPTNYAALEKTSVQAGTQDIMAVFPIQPFPNGMPTSDLTPEQLWGVDGVYQSLNNQPFVKRMLPASKAAQTYKGKLYGVNTGVYQVGIFYNKAIFAKYHLKPPTTLKQFDTLANTLESHKVVPLYYATAGGAQVYDWVMLMDAELMSLWPGNVDNQFWSGKASFTNPKFIQALTQAKALTKYMEPNWQGENWTGMPGAFASGKAAMLLDGSWDMASVLTANPKMQIGYFPLPGSNNAKRNQSILQPDLTWVVLKNGPDKASALKWINYFTQPKVYAQYVKNTGISPAFKGNYPSATQKILGKYLSKGLLEANAEPLLPSAGPIALQPNNFYNALQNVLTGQTSPKQAASQWETAWKQLLSSKK